MNKVLIGLVLAVVLSGNVNANTISEADLILSSDNVILMTGDKKAQPLSIAITNKKIVWVGLHKDAKNIQGTKIDFGNQAILPGFIDAHGHASYLAFASQVATLHHLQLEKLKQLKTYKLNSRNLLKFPTFSLVNG